MVFFTVVWNDILLAAILALQVGLIFIRNDILHTVLSVLSVAGEVGLIAACLVAQATLTECLLVLAIVAFVSALCCLIEYNLFDKNAEIARCAVLAAQAKERADDLEYRFVSPLYGEKAAKPTATTAAPSEPEGKPAPADEAPAEAEAPVEPEQPEALAEGEASESNETNETNETNESEGEGTEQ